MFGFGKKNKCSDCVEPCKASHNNRTSCTLFKPKDDKVTEILSVTVYRTGDDLQYVTMNINDWYKVLKNLKRPIHNKWGVKNGKR